MNKDAPTSRKGGVYELLGSEAMVYKISTDNSNDMPSKPWKQADQILLLGILHIENKILERIRETRAN